MIGERFDEVHLHGFGIARPGFVSDSAQDVVFQAVGYVKWAFVLVELDGTVVGREMIPVQGADFGFDVVEIGHGFVLKPLSNRIGMGVEALDFGHADDVARGFLQALVGVL